MRKEISRHGTKLLAACFVLLIPALVGCGKTPGKAPSNPPIAAKSDGTKKAPMNPDQAKPAASLAAPSPVVVTSAEAAATPTPRYVYNPGSRRDPFLSLASMEKGMGKEVRPPLQRASLNQVQVIGIIWGAYGYSAMVQLPDGKGYTVRSGTLIGPTGVVRRVTEKAVLVEEPYIDFLGDQKMRLTKLTLHPQQEGEE